MIDYMLVMRSSNRNKVQDMADKFPGQALFTAGKKAWAIPCDIALPCAFQNELSEDDAKKLSDVLVEVKEKTTTQTNTSKTATNTNKSKTATAENTKKEDAQTEGGNS